MAVSDVSTARNPDATDGTNCDLRRNCGVAQTTCAPFWQVTYATYLAKGPWFVARVLSEAPWVSPSCILAAGTIVHAFTMLESWPAAARTWHAGHFCMPCKLLD